MPGLSEMSYQDRLKELDLPSLVYRSYRGNMIEVYNYLPGLYEVDHSTLIPLITDPEEQLEDIV